MNKLRTVVIVSVFLIAGAVLIYLADFSKPEAEIKWGATFSQKYSSQLGLDWRDNYLALLNNMKVDHLRLPAYWDLVEPRKDFYNLTDLNWQLQEAAKRKVGVVLVIGERLPRWPECHYPDWITEENRQTEMMELLKTLVKTYQTQKNIIAWQIDNEPFLDIFGECPIISPDYLKQKINLVRSLDNRPIMITDSGELSWWTKTSEFGDILGSSLYHIVGDKKFGYYHHIFPSSFYTFKKWLAQNFFGANKVVFSEVQLEPWSVSGFLSDLSQEEQESQFGPDKIKTALDFAKKTGFSDIYLWGAEWWYWQKLYGNEEIWETVAEVWE